MKGLQLLLQNWANKINAMTLRERAILFLVSVVSVLLVVNEFFIDPEFAKQKLLAQRVQQDQAKISALRGELTQRLSGQRFDPDADNKLKVQKLRQELAHMDLNVQTTQSKLVPPEKMGVLIEEILRRNRGLQLVSLKSLPATDILGETADGTSSAKGGGKIVGIDSRGAIFRHEIELEVEGNYLDMIAYMRELEKMPQQVYWNTASLHVERFPKARLTLRLFTLSLDKSWLNL